MPHFVATYAYTQDAEGRAGLRPTHREYLASLPQLVASGPTDAGGAVLVFEAGSAAEVEDLLAADPFVQQGFVATRSVVGWEVVAGRLRDHF